MAESMHVRIGLTALTLASVLLHGCGGSADEAAGDVISRAPGSMGAGAFTLELEQVFGGSESTPETLLGRVSAVAVDDNFNVYVLDAQAAEIVAFYSSGAIAWRAGGPGVGPGEIQYPGDLVATTDRLILVNQGGTRLDSYDLGGNYVDARSRRAGRGFAELTCSVGDDAILETRGLRGQWKLSVTETTFDEYQTTRTDSSGVLAEIEFDVDVELPAEMAHQASVDCGTSGLLVHHPAAYRIERWSFEGERLGSFGRNDVGYGPPSVRQGNQGGIVYVPTFRAHPVLELQGGRHLVVAHWLSDPSITDAIAASMLGEGPSPDRSYEHSFDLYDADGTLLSTIPGDGDPTIGFPEVSDRTGRIYTVATEPYPQVRRYRVRDEF